MAARRIQEFLDGNHVRYAMIQHSPAYSASEVAQSVHISGRNLAKVVIVVINNRLAMAVVPATRDVDLNLLQRVTGFLDVRLAEEAEFADRFEGCQLGAAPPFGNLFGIDTYVEPRLLQQSHIGFNAGTHHQAILMKSDDYARLACPIVTHIAAEPIHDRFAAITIYGFGNSKRQVFPCVRSNTNDRQQIAQARDQRPRLWNDWNRGNCSAARLF